MNYLFNGGIASVIRLTQNTSILSIRRISFEGTTWGTFNGLDVRGTCHDADANDDEQIEGCTAHDGTESTQVKFPSQNE